MNTPEVTPGTPTYDDATLLNSIMNGFVTQNARDGIELLWAYGSSPSYVELVRDHPIGSENYRDVIAVLSLGELIGTFVKNGVLHRGLVLDLIWMAGLWERCHVIAEDLRNLRKNPKLFENFEALTTK